MSGSCVAPAGEGSPNPGQWAQARRWRRYPHPSPGLAAPSVARGFCGTSLVLLQPQTCPRGDSRCVFPELSVDYLSPFPTLP